MSARRDFAYSNFLDEGLLFHDCILNYQTHEPILNIYRADRSRMGKFRTFTQANAILTDYSDYRRHRYQDTNPDVLICNEFYPVDVCSNGLTILADVSLDRLNQERDLVSRPYADPMSSPNYEYLLRVRNGGQVRIKMGSNTTDVGSLGLSINTRYHFVWTADGATWKLYLDGEEVYSAANSNLPGNTNSIPIHIGGDADNGSPADARFYSAMIWPRALGAADVLKLYQMRNAGSEASTYDHVWYPKATATGAFTLTADSGSYNYSGTAANVEFGASLAANSGSYVYSGTDATLTFASPGSFTLTADSGSYAYSGTDASLLFGGVVSADTGSYTYTGTAADLIHGYTLAANSGSYVYNGTDVDFSNNFSLAADLGSYIYNGTNATLTAAIEGWVVQGVDTSDWTVQAKDSSSWSVL